MPTNALSKYIELGQAYKSGQITSSDVAATAPQPQAPAGGSSGYEALGRAYKSGQITSSDISSAPSQGGDMQSSLNSLLSVVNGGNNLQSSLRVTQEKWDSTLGAYDAYKNNRNSPDFVYDENVNRNQYNSIKSLIDDTDADMEAQRQQGNNINADTMARDRQYLQSLLDDLDAEYNANRPAEAEQKREYIDNSIQKTLGPASEYSQQASDLESQIAELERTNRRGVIRQDTDAVSGELYDVYGNVNDEALHQLREQLQNTNANKAAAERAELRETYKGNADYAQNSAAATPLAENPEAQKLINQWINKRGNVLGGTSTDAVSGEGYTEQSTIDLLGYATEDENQMFNYILNTQGEDAAREYIDDLRYDLNARQASAKSQEASQYADEHEVKASAKSVGQNLISGAGLFDTAIQNVYRDITGNNRRIDYNTWANQQGQQVQATRGTVAQELTDKYGTKKILGKDVSWGDAYQLGMSMLDSGATAALGGVTGLGSGTAALIGASAGTQAMQEAARDGASDSQALALGFAAMAAETITEKVSLENLLSAPGKTILTNALRQAGIEASEEAASTVLNELANETVMGEDSDFNKRVREYEANGMPHEEAQQQAWNQFGTQLLWDAIGGAVSGGIMGGMAKPIRNNIDSRTQQNTETQTTEQTASTPLAETVNRANQQTTEETAQTAPQNSPTEQTSVSETNTPLTNTVLNATEAQQTASAPRVSENAENSQGPRPFDMGQVARDVWNQQTQQAQEQTAANASDQAETQQTTAQEQTPFTSNISEEGNGPQVESGFSENISTDSARDEQIQQMFEEDPQFYRQKTNADTLKNAKSMLGENFDVDPTEAVGKVRAALDNAKNGMKLKPETVPATKLVADKLAEQARALEAEGKTAEAQAKMQTARGLLADLASELTQAGQLGQAARILRNQGPAVRAQYITNLLDEFNNGLTKRQSEKISKRQAEAGQEATGRVEVPQELLNAFRDADTAEAQETALHDIAAYVGENTPSTLYQKWTNLRFTNMLGNFVTQIRNVLGNSTSSLNHMVKRRINGNIENAVKNVDRSFAGRYGTSELASWWNAFKSDPQIENAAMNGGRYDTVRKLNKGAFGQDVESNQTVYGGRDPVSRYLEAKRKATNWATEQGDVIFQRLNFADAAAGYAKAHGFTFETATDAQKADAVEYAIKEAQEATFHNDTALSDLVTGLHIKENSQFAKAHPVTAKVVNALGDGLLPFRKTPANILTQAEEFSPLGLINTAVKAAQAKQGNATASDVINSFSKAMTGTGVMGLGMMMRALGKARASDDDEERSDYAKLNGEQDYAIKLGDHWVTADWVAPDSIPFFMGVKFMDILAERDGFQTDDITQFLGGMTDTFLNMSMLQGLNDTLENLNGFGTDADAMPKLATSLAISYLTQGLGSSLAGRIESAFTENRQDTYTDPDSPLSKDLQYAIGRLGNKILGADFQQADYIDAWGNKQKGQGVDNPLVRAALAMFSPSYVREDTTTDFDRGLMELHDQLEGTDFQGEVLPKHISRSTVVGDKKLTPEEYEIYATNVGQMRRQMAEAFWNSDLRETLSPEEQGKVITEIYEYCASRGKADILERRGEPQSKNDQWADEVEHFGDDVNALTRYLAAKDVFKDSLASGDYEAIDSLLNTIDSHTNADGEFTNKETQYYTDNIDGLEKYILANRAGVDSEMLTLAKEQYSDLNKQDLSKAEMTTRLANWVDSSRQTNDWTDTQKDAVKDLLRYYNMSPVNTERYERMGDYGVEPNNISAVESKLETLSATDGFGDLTSSQQTYKKYDVILKEAAAMSDDQALAVARSYGSLGPGAGKLKYMIQQYFGDKDLDFQIEMYNAIRDERGWSHNWNSTIAVAP